MALLVIIIIATHWSMIDLGRWNQHPQSPTRSQSFLWFGECGKRFSRLRTVFDISIRRGSAMVLTLPACLEDTGATAAKEDVSFEENLAWQWFTKSDGVFILMSFKIKCIWSMSSFWRVQVYFAFGLFYKATFDDVYECGSVADLFDWFCSTLHYLTVLWVSRMAESWCQLADIFRKAIDCPFRRTIEWFITFWSEKGSCRVPSPWLIEDYYASFDLCFQLN